MGKGFKNYVTSIPPVNVDDYLVTYAINNPISISGNIILIEGYLSTAELIIQQIYSQPLSAADDKFALPLLNLYINILEFSLKILLIKVIKHQTDGCQFTNIPNNIIKNANKLSKTTHDLNKLLNSAEELLNFMPIIHSFSDFKEISNFIKGFSETGFTSENTRYFQNKTGSSIHKQQFYIHFKKIHQKIKTISCSIRNYVEGDRFNLCDAGNFTSERIKELIFTHATMLKYKKIFTDFSQKSYEINKKYVNEMGIIVLGNQLSFDEIMQTYTWEENFRQEIKQFNHEEAAVILMGLYFGSTSPDCIERLDDFLSHADSYLKEKIYVRAHLYKKALKHLSQHITNLKQFIFD